jgi:hypothetical protein
MAFSEKSTLIPWTVWTDAEETNVPIYLLSVMTLVIQARESKYRSCRESLKVIEMDFRGWKTKIRQVRKNVRVCAPNILRSVCPSTIDVARTSDLDTFNIWIMASSHTMFTLKTRRLESLTQVYLFLAALVTQKNFLLGCRLVRCQDTSWLKAFLMARKGKFGRRFIPS